MLTYTELVLLKTFQERLDYLYVGGVPGELVFGHLRKWNQRFYNSKAWKKVREEVIFRDLIYDLGIPGRSIYGKVIVHHMNPLSPTELLTKEHLALDPEFLITVSNDTHLGIHFGYLPEPTGMAERFEGDTNLW